MKVSVIIPAYNSAQTLDVAIQSIVGQTLREIEIILINNNSTDTTMKIMERWSAVDERIRILNCTRQGVATTRNMGIVTAKGDYVFFLDSDDTLEPCALSELYSAAVRTCADMVCPNILYSSGRKKKPMDKSTVDEYAEGGDIVRLFHKKLTSYVFYGVPKLCNMSFLRKNNIFFDESYSGGEDVVFNIGVLSHASSVYYISKCLYTYNVSTQGLNLGLRKNFSELKEKIHLEVKEYLVSEGFYDKKYATILMNDIFAIFYNNLKLGIPISADCVLSRFIQELFSIKAFWTLGLSRKIIYLLLKLKWYGLICAICRIY